MPDVRYSVILGSLQASAQDDPVVAETYRFHKHMIFQDPGLMARLPDWVAGLERPDVVALPVYFWNRAPVMLIAREVKRRWPDCTVILGGNDVSHQTEQVFAEEAVDVLVHGEGEITFRRLLASGPATGALDEIPGISYRRAGRVVTTAAAERITDLSCLPSPLLSGVYSDEDIAASRTIILETNRGCPYSCSFCYWGGATKSKVRPFPLERVKQEITHIVTHAPPHATIFLADANFGILPRDPEIAEWLVTELKRQGKRMFLFTNWAKNTNKRVLEAARILYSNQLISAVTLSAQSFTPEVLQIARRSNIRTSYYRQLQSDFQAMGVPTYTELIWGLPGETLATHLGSVEEAITSGGHPVVYPLLLLNNTEYTTASVRGEQELVTRVLPYQVSNPEMKAEFVVQHRAMPLADWRRGMAIRLALAVFHGCLLRSLLRYLHARMGVRVVDMLDLLVGFLGDGCPEPVVRRLAADHFESLLDPEALDTGLLGRYLPADCIPEHPHYQSIIRHLAASEGTGKFVAAAAAYLWNALRPETRPPADEYRTVVEYQQAIAAVLAASVRGVAATRRVALPAGLHEVLVEAGQVRPVTVANGTAHVDLDGAEIARMPVDALLLAVYHGSVHVPRSLQPAVAVV